jgi:Cft2 family RNA processing exonuclease
MKHPAKSHGGPQTPKAAPHPPRPGLVIVESTYGVSRHLARAVREKRFIDKVRARACKGGGQETRP